MTQVIIADHNCGYDIDIYQTEEEDGAWRINLDAERGINDQIINYCPMCGKRLNDRYYDY